MRKQARGRARSVFPARLRRGPSGRGSPGRPARRASGWWLAAVAAAAGGLLLAGRGPGGAGSGGGGGGALAAAVLSPLGRAPDWSGFGAAWQGTVTAAECEGWLREVYAPRGGWEPWLRVVRGGEGGADRLLVRRNAVPLNDLVVVPLAPANGAARAVPPRFWRPRAALPPAADPVSRPLEGVRVALDPGHLGGRWAQLEERWFQLGTGRPVVEGEMTLLTAQHLADQLRARGAQVTLVREREEPVTPQRPADFVATARDYLLGRGITQIFPGYRGPVDPNRPNSLRWNSEMLFLRADIRARARLVNEQLRPDLVVCLHFNAEAWGDPARPALVDRNHAHVLINGCYLPDELAQEDTRLELLRKLLGGCYPEERAVAAALAPSLERQTGLPPYVYTGPNAVRVGGHPYLWARNLLANRLYECPVVYLEPYVMNSPDVFSRVQAGDYEGRRLVGGTFRLSLYREYAQAVSDGLADYYRQRGAGSEAGRNEPAPGGSGP